MALSAVALTWAAAGGCGSGEDGTLREVPGRAGEQKSAAGVRAARRAYDGAPPVVPHRNFGVECVSCHNARGMEVDGVGFAPPSPHEETQGMSAMSHCRQCHVEVRAAGLFRENGFQGIAQDMRHGERMYAGAPPVLPHPVFMRENCLACHTGPAAREGIRTDHPERVNCRQCHAAAKTDTVFVRGRP